MPASVVPITRRRQGTYVLLDAALPGQPLHHIGVFLLDPDNDRAWIRMRERYDDLADPEDAEVLEALAEGLQKRCADEGATACLEFLEDCLSNALLVTERQAIEVDAFTRVLDQLFEAHVDKIEVDRFRTHLPLYSLRAAAGSLGEEMRSDPEEWVRAPEGMRLSDDLFVAHVVGESMEPRIPDGSLNLFRFHPVGSRQGKFVLIERYGVLDETARYTVKRYTSKKVWADEEQWAHEQIRLEPLNPEFEAWDVGPEDFAVVAEWLRVIE